VTALVRSPVLVMLGITGLEKLLPETVPFPFAMLMVFLIGEQEAIPNVVRVIPQERRAKHAGEKSSAAGLERVGMDTLLLLPVILPQQQARSAASAGKPGS